MFVTFYSASHYPFRRHWIRLSVIYSACGSRHTVAIAAVISTTIHGFCTTGITASCYLFRKIQNAHVRRISSSKICLIIVLLRNFNGPTMKGRTVI